MKKMHFVIALFGVLLLLGSLTIKVIGEESFAHLTKEEIAQKVSEELKTILGSSLSDEEKAEQITHLGELTLIPQGFTFSLDLFEKALSFHAEHPRSNYYAALLKPLMTLEKVPGKILSGDLLPALWKNELSQKTEEIPAEYKGFFIDPNIPSWNKISEFQVFVKIDFLPLLEISLQRLQKISGDKDLRFYFDQSAWSGDDALPYEIDHAVIETTEASLRGLIFLSKSFVAYNWNDLFEFEKWLAENYSLRTLFDLLSWDELRTEWPAIVRHLRQEFQKLGTLADKDILSSALADTESFVTLLRTAYPLLCKRFNEDLPQDFESTMEKLSNLLAGPDLLVLGQDAKTGEELSVLINAPILFQEPMADLKSLLPFVPSELTTQQKEELETLIAQMGDDSWEVRETASQAITERFLSSVTAIDVVSILRNQADGSPDIEIRYRAKHLLAVHQERVANEGYPLTFIDLTFGGLFPNGDLLTTLARLEKNDQNRLKNRFPGRGW